MYALLFLIGFFGFLGMAGLSFLHSGHDSHTGNHGSTGEAIGSLKAIQHGHELLRLGLPVRAGTLSSQLFVLTTVG